jgi:hypothetical protein
MKRMRSERLLLWIIAVLLPAVAATPAAAYVGPGAGLSLLGALWGVVIAIGAAVGFIILWPLRRYLRKNRTGMATGRMQEQAAPSNAARSPQKDVSHHGAV